MNPEYIVVQAGGKGSRLEHLTANKPKALVPIGNLPMLFHLFRQFPDKKFVIIADYQSDVMRRYLSAFADVQYLVVTVHGKQGTCAGISMALEKIPDGVPWMLIWSDLVLHDKFNFPRENGNFIGLSKGFPCRWRYQENRFDEIPSEEAGVAGLFLFENKSFLQDVPSEGEFVRWLQSKSWEFNTIPLERTREYGLLSNVETIADGDPAYRCRPFNQIKVSSDGQTITKEGIDEQGRALAVREKAWYKFVAERGFRHVPLIYSYEPFVMQRVAGKNIFDYDLDKDQKTEVLNKLICCLRELHTLGETPTDWFSVYDAYVKKTWVRLDKIRDLVPFADREAIVINGKLCRNVFYHKAQVEELFAQYPCKRFVLLHGDNTFSNMMLNEGMEPVLIDPRGYFGHTELYGDPAYDWAKLYYSIVGNYDQFNQKRFTLDILPDGVRLSIQSNGWEEMEDEFFELLGDEVQKEYIRLIHAVIWLSLTTYAWEDYDSICGAFYNGLYYLEDALPKGDLL